MEINYVLGTYPTLLEAMVAKVYENDSGAEVDSITIPERDASNNPDPGGGHNHTYAVSFTGLDRRPHTLKLFTAVGGTLLQNFNIQPTEISVTIYDPIYFKIGDGGADTPAEGDTAYVNAILANLTNDRVRIYRAGLRQYPEQDFEMNILGGFSLVKGGDSFTEGEEVFIDRIPLIVSNPVHDSVVGKQWGGNATLTTIYKDVTASVNYDASHLRHYFRISGSGAYHFTSGADIPIGYPFRFINMAGGNPIIYFENGVLNQYPSNVTQWTLPAGAIAEFVWNGASWDLVQDCGQEAAAYRITYQGSQAIGNVGALPNGDGSYNSFFTVNIPDQGTTNYKVRGTLISNSTNMDVDNDISWVITILSATQFKVALGKRLAVTTNITFDYSIELAS
jgi:hypothetical protein